MIAVFAQRTAKMKTFQVFGSDIIGHMFMPDDISCGKEVEIFSSPVHGRAVALKKSDFEWISVKGGGWNYGGPQIYLSAKEEELVFGLYPLSSATRELRVSEAIGGISDEFPKVLYYKKFSDYHLPEEFAFLSGVKFQNGTLVEPCLLYTRVKCPFRVADLMYFTEEEKKRAVEQCCHYWKIETRDFTMTFTKVLASHVSILHKHGFINDTLDFGNVTLLAEIIDYEWVTAPDIDLLDGTDGSEMRDGRREKELLYGAEVCLQLKALLHEEYCLYDIYRAFIDVYGKENGQWIENSHAVQKMLKKEKFIL